MSFSPLSMPLPAPSTGAASSIWARRKITKCPTTPDTEVELNVLSLLLDVPLASLDEQSLTSSPSPTSAGYSPWSTDYRSTTPLYSPLPPPIQRSKSTDGYFESTGGYNHLEMHTAQTAVKAALDVLEEPSLLSRGLRISTTTTAHPGVVGRGCLTAPLSPALSSPISPAESCFSGTESGAENGKKKGRARMSQEKRKRLARRREREALVAALQQPSSDYLSHQSTHQGWSHSAPTTPIRSSFPSFPFGGYEAFTSNGYEIPSSPALTTGSTRTTSSGSYASIGTPSSSPITTTTLSAGIIGGGGEISSSPPRLVVQPPSPQRLRVISRPTIKSPSTNQLWNFPSHSASVY